jgi:hypothetical protein
MTVSNTANRFFAAALSVVVSATLFAYAIVPATPAIA